MLMHALYKGDTADAVLL